MPDQFVIHRETPRGPMPAAVFPYYEAKSLTLRKAADTTRERRETGSVEASASRLDSLTGIRFVAAFYVLVLHCCPLLSKRAQASLLGYGHRGGAASIVGRAAAAFLGGIVSSGGISVSLFFVLSGFILAFNAARDTRCIKRPALAPFYLSRFARIYPLYLLSWVVAAPIAYVELTKAHIAGLATPSGRLAAGAATSLTLTQSWWPDLMRRWNSPAWSLSTEALFYLCFPFLLKPVVRICRKKVMFRGALAMLWAIGAAPLILRCFSGSHGALATFVNRCPLLRLPEFIMGMMAGVQFVHDRARGRRRFSGWELPAAAAILSLAVCSPVLPREVLSNGFVAPLFLILIWALAVRQGPTWLGSPALVKLGEASYATYILHTPVLIFLAHATDMLTRMVSGSRALRHQGVIASSLPYFMLQVAVIVTVSLAACSFVEAPCRRWIVSKVRGVADKSAANPIDSCPPRMQSTVSRSY